MSNTVTSEQRTEVSTALFGSRSVAVAPTEYTLADMVRDNLNATARGLPEVHPLTKIIEVCGMCTPARLCITGGW